MIWFDQMKKIKNNKLKTAIVVIGDERVKRIPWAYTFFLISPEVITFFWAGHLPYSIYLITVDYRWHVPRNTRHSSNGASMLGHRRRRWTSIEAALGECLGCDDTYLPEVPQVSPCQCGLTAQNVATQAWVHLDGNVISPVIPSFVFTE